MLIRKGKNVGGAVNVIVFESLVSLQLIGGGNGMSVRRRIRCEDFEKTGESYFCA